METHTLAHLALAAYLAVLTLICVYGAHRYVLLAMYYRVRRRSPKPTERFQTLPRVTIQLPIYNERFVVERIIESACRVDYPRELLQIQVLDDSTDETRELADAAVARLRAEGHDIACVRRPSRVGYKAGALEHATPLATGEFIAIFDADFVPPPEILMETVHFFTDPQVGMVQARWEHINREHSLLTRAQAILLDGHFVIEHTARNRNGRYMSFNGTAGVWRKSAIADAGGWEHDTLTEDLDLSYRAQLRGWRFVFLPDITSPAELPPEMSAFKAQQHRWTKGGAQTCAKLLGRVLTSRAPLGVKLEAFFHLTSGAVYVLMVLLSLLIGPALLAKLVITEQPPEWLMAYELVLFIIGFGSPIAFYLASQTELMRGWWYALRHVPALMAVGIGIAFNNAVAVIDGVFGRTGEFVRTPKFGDAAGTRGSAFRQRLAAQRPRSNWKPWAELAMGCYILACGLSLLAFENWFERVSLALPFLAMFVFGYFYVALSTLHAQWVAHRDSAAA